MRLTKEISHSKYFTERIFEVSNKKEEKITVTQLHFLGWPDHGVPLQKSEAMRDFDVILMRLVDLILLNNG